MGEEARNFSTSTNYAAGDLCLYNGVLYAFTQTHSAGAWDENDVEKVDKGTEEQIARMIAALDNARKATAYVNTLVFEPVYLYATKYKYSFTNAPDPR